MYIQKQFYGNCNTHTVGGFQYLASVFLQHAITNKNTSICITCIHSQRKKNHHKSISYTAIHKLYIKHITSIENHSQNIITEIIPLLCPATITTFISSGTVIPQCIDLCCMQWVAMKHNGQSLSSERLSLEHILPYTAQAENQTIPVTTHYDNGHD